MSTDLKRRNVPFSPPDMTEAEANEVRDAILSGWITTGPRTKKLEKEISEYVHTEKTVCLNSATASMEMALHILGVGPGDEVIVPAYTYTASASVVSLMSVLPLSWWIHRRTMSRWITINWLMLSRNAPKSLSLWILLVSALMWIRFVR